MNERVSRSATLAVSAGVIAFHYLRWMGRAAMFCLGLAMVLSLVVGLAVLAATMTLAIVVPATSPVREAWTQGAGARARRAAGARDVG